MEDKKVKIKGEVKVTGEVRVEGQPVELEGKYVPLAEKDQKEKIWEQEHEYLARWQELRNKLGELKYEEVEIVAKGLRLLYEMWFHLWLAGQKTKKRGGKASEQDTIAGKWRDAERVMEYLRQEFLSQYNKKLTRPQIAKLCAILDTKVPFNYQSLQPEP